MKTTRQKILEYLDVKDVATAEELSKHLKRTPANIRHHLSILVGQGSIEVSGLNSSHERGRPAQLYTLVKLSHLTNLDRLSSALLHELITGLSAEELTARLLSISQHLCDLPDITRKNPTRRLYAAIAALNSMHYQANWEARKDAPRIMLNHCPYAAILPDHPELCRLDSILIEQMLEAEATLIAKLVLTAQGTRHCIFSVSGLY